MINHRSSYTLFPSQAQANNTKGPGKDEDEGVDVGRHEGGPQNGNRSPPPLLPPAPLRTSTPEPEGEEVQPMDHYYKINYDILGGEFWNKIHPSTYGIDSETHFSSRQKLLSYNYFVNRLLEVLLKECKNTFVSNAPASLHLVP